jgi:predicted SAM-dependent methyltransferase
MTGLIERLKRTEDPALRHVLLRGRGAAHWVVAGHRRRAATVRRYLQATDEPKLHIGAGPMRLDGWLNTDLISGEAYVDLTRPLPFADATFAYAFGEHVIEHLGEADGARLMRELHRVLRPGGVLRLTTPDLRKIIAIYEDRNPIVGRQEYARFLDEQTGKRHDRPSQIFNDYTRLWGHQWIYDEEDLAARLREAGFATVERMETGESPRPALRGLERHGGAEWVNRAEAMCLEARRAA